MGSTQSLFSDPRKCTICKSDHNTVWCIDYQNEEIDEYNKKNNFLRQDVKDLNPSLDTLGGVITFAQKKLDEIEPKVGRIIPSVSTNVRMYQYLCTPCFRKIRVSGELEKLPEGWSYEVDYKESGFRLCMLP